MLNDCDDGIHSLPPEGESVDTAAVNAEPPKAAWGTPPSDPMNYLLPQPPMTYPVSVTEAQLLMSLSDKGV